MNVFCCSDFQVTLYTHFYFVFVLQGKVKEMERREKSECQERTETGNRKEKVQCKLVLG